MERDFTHLFENAQQQAEIPGVQRRMGMAAHIYHLAKENVARVHGMQRIDLGMLSPVKIVDIVALNGLIEKRQSQDQDEQRNDEKFPAQVTR